MGILRIPFPISRFTQWDVSSSVPYTFLLLGIPVLVSIISNYQIQHVRHSSLPWPSLCRSCCCGRLSACLLAGPGGLGRATLCAGFLRWARCSFAGSLVLHDPTARDWHRVAGGSRLTLSWRKDVTRTCFSHFPPWWTGDLLCPANSSRFRPVPWGRLNLEVNYCHTRKWTWRQGPCKTIAHVPVLQASYGAQQGVDECYWMLMSSWLLTGSTCSVGGAQGSDETLWSGSTSWDRRTDFVPHEVGQRFSRPVLRISGPCLSDGSSVLCL